MTPKCSGGDVTRERKIFERRRMGKKRLRQIVKIVYRLWGADTLKRVQCHARNLSPDPNYTVKGL